MLVEQINAPDQIRSVVGGDGQAICPPVYQLVDLPENLGGVPALDLSQFHLQAEGPQLLRGLPGPGGHILHGRCLCGLENHTQPDTLLGADQGLANRVGAVAQLLRDFENPSRHFRVDPAPVVEGPVYRAPGDPRQLGDLL